MNAAFLREQAQRCARLARECPHLPTSHELEAMGMDLMERAAELDELLAIRGEESKDRGPGN
jgi:hypothetical protein